MKSLTRSFFAKSSPKSNKLLEHYCFKVFY